MKQFKFILPSHIADFCGPDIKRMVDICADRGYYITEADAWHAWEEHSDNNATVWAELPGNDDEIFSIISSNCEVVEHEN